jgi:osmotically-inducible protein OsmY
MVVRPAAFVCVLVLGLGCARGTDTEENVRKALQQANMSSVEILVDENANTVHLAGTVKTLADRTRAEEIAAATVGTSGRVVNDLTVEVLEEPTETDPDQLLTNAIDHALDGDAVLKERDVNVDVAGGRVTLTGEVRTSRERTRVEEIVRGVSGVSEVANELKIQRER